MNPFSFAVEIVVKRIIVIGIFFLLLSNGEFRFDRGDPTGETVCCDGIKSNIDKQPFRREYPALE